MNLIYTQNFPVRPETFGKTLVHPLGIKQNFHIHFNTNDIFFLQMAVTLANANLHDIQQMSLSNCTILSATSPGLQAMLTSSM